MKKIVWTFFLFLGWDYSFGQTLTHDDFAGLIPYLQAEDWKSAFHASDKLLKSAETDTSEYHAIIVYINIFSAAGMVTEKQMSFRELEKNVLKFQGQKIIMSAHPVTTQEGALRQTQFDVSDSTNEAFTAATNAQGVNILCMEHFLFKDKINPEDFPEHSMVRCGGILEKIETNPNKSMLWILRLTVKDAFARRSG